MNSDIEDDNDVAEEEEALLGAGGMPAAGRHEADGMGHSAMNSMMTRIADEREAGIRRIQNQVILEKGHQLLSPHTPPPPSRRNKK